MTTAVFFEGLVEDTNRGFKRRSRALDDGLNIVRAVVEGTADGVELAGVVENLRRQIPGDRLRIALIERAEDGLEHDGDLALGITEGGKGIRGGRSGQGGQTQWWIRARRHLLLDSGDHQRTDAFGAKLVEDGRGGCEGEAATLDLGAHGGVGHAVCDKAFDLGEGEFGRRGLLAECGGGPKHEHESADGQRKKNTQ